MASSLLLNKGYLRLRPANTVGERSLLNRATQGRFSWKIKICIVEKGFFAPTAKICAAPLRNLTQQSFGKWLATGQRRILHSLTAWKGHIAQINWPYMKHAFRGMDTLQHINSTMQLYDNPATYHIISYHT